MGSHFHFKTAVRKMCLSFNYFIIDEKQVTAMTDYFITAHELMETLKVKSKTTFWRMRKRGDVPKPTIKNPLRWKLSEIENYYQDRLKGIK